MPITINTNQVSFKNGNDYITFDAIADESTAQRLANIEEAGSSQIAAIQTAGAEARASVPPDYTGLSDKVGNISDPFGINIFVPDALIRNKDLGTDGIPVDSQLYDITDFIDIGNNAQITFRLFEYTGAVSFTIYQYSDNNNNGFISRIGNSSYLPGRTVILNSSAKYVRFRVEKSQANYINPYKVMVVLGSTTITEFVPYYTAYDRTARGMITRLDESAFEIKYGAYSGNDANDIDENSRYSCLASSVNNLPSSDSGAYIVDTTFTTSNHNNGIQIAYNLDTGKRYWRNKNGGTWSDDWVTWDSQNSRMRPKYIALGDSIMYGAVWTQELVDQGTNWYRANVENRIPTRIAHAVGADDNFVNASVSGAYFVGNGSNTILAQIQSANITDARLITIAGGRNDSSTTFGSVSSTSGDGTLCGAIREVIEYIQENAPKCQIVMIQVTPNARTNSEVFTRTFSGGWSLNSYKEVVSQICAEYCVPFVDWEGCSLFKNWITFTSAGNNNVHPSSEDVYYQMGNYIAGKVSAVYKG